ncbi:calcium-transporting ATPase [Martiniozyma asiatica (nom. inval.)]|nr:calcium-transporting ATPase [Martiniozyma asiatica]
MSDLENQASVYQIPISKLQAIFDPKSLLAIHKLGGYKHLLQALNTDTHDGLDSNNLDRNAREEAYGANEIPQRIPKTFLELALDALADPIMITLSIFAVISLALGLYQTFYLPPDLDEEGHPLPKVDWVEGIAIILAILIVILVTAINDYRKEKQFMKLNAKREVRNIIVFRNAQKTYISITELLVGDLLYVETGDILPADAILISGKCQCDESSVTGESKTINKNPIDEALDSFNPSLGFDITDDHHIVDPILISGSKLISGQGRAMVVCVGQNSMHGKTMMSLNIVEESTPLQENLEKLTEGISTYAFLSSIILLIFLSIKFLINWHSGEFEHFPKAKFFAKIMDIFITAITIVVVAIPEGLPLAVTLALAFATTRMAQDGNLVRVLKSCETMGSATTICSDKTGTLTLNKMSVVECIIGKTAFEEEDGNLKFAITSLNSNIQKIILENIALNSTAFENEVYGTQIDEFDCLHPKKSFATWLSSKLRLNSSNGYQSLLPTNTQFNQYAPSSTLIEGHPRPHGSTDQFVGSKTECALLSFASETLSGKYPNIKQIQLFRDSYESKIKQIIPFESELKWSGLVLQNENNDYTIYIKGAAEIIFCFCDSYTDVDGEIKNIDKSSTKEMYELNNSLASKALRAVSLAHFTIPSETVNGKWTSLTPKEISKFPFVLDMSVGIQDPLRPNVKKAIENCHRAGVNVRMVTGDNLLTAKAISYNCSILNDETLNDPLYYIEGPEFRKLSSDERKERVKYLHVMARSSPEDKRILVETLKQLGEVVAVTGDGTNDAPALKLADVGFSMGMSGTEVAREASDIVLMNDDFSSIIDAIKWGRTIGTSIRKFVQFQLTVNVTAVILTFWTAVSSKDSASVLTAVQLLWVNLIMDTLAALALATDKPSKDVLDSKPAGRQSSMIDIGMWKMILGMSFVQLFITIGLFYYGGEIIYGKPKINLTGYEAKTLAAMNFNTFVWMQVFTLFVSRKLNEAQSLTSIKERFSSTNIGFFSGLNRNWYFIAIVALISFGQFIIMSYGGFAFAVTPQSGKMWTVSILGGVSMLPCGALLRLIPDDWILKYFPLKKLSVILSWVEWALFGFGLWDWVTRKIFGEPSGDEGETESTESQGPLTPTDGIAEFGERDATPELHRLNRLGIVDGQLQALSSCSSSGDSLPRSSYKPGKGKYGRLRSPSQEFLDSTKDNRYTEVEDGLIV